MGSASAPIGKPAENPGFEELPEALPYMAWWVRMNLVLVALGIATVLTIGAFLHPYDQNHQPLRQETHRQLGLPPCSFYAMTGLPCPSCGFTTSFSLLMHADPVNSLKANTVGALLAAFCLVVVPWSLISALRGRYMLIRSAEKAIITSLIAFVVLMLVRWGVVLAVAKWG
jgi:Protein of unknown function (DUF2752)